MRRISHTRPLPKSHQSQKGSSPYAHRPPPQSLHLPVLISVRATPAPAVALSTPEGHSLIDGSLSPSVSLSAPPVRTANPTSPSCSSIFLSVLFDDYSSFQAREIITSVMVRSGCVECVSELGAKRDIGRLPQTVIARQDIYSLRR